ncbi:MAG TPA: bifunctional rhamnulose-1-phosphate aldolase/short-chain dehydrogenase [Armatimonadota bacterium]|jgi:rhamnulose-1-phosphate aldolase/alcohol dehydrogenase
MERVKDLWNDSEAAGLSDIDTLAYASRLLGADPGLVVWGGGNTSIKTTEIDFRGRQTPVLRVKGSGSDLKVAKPADFPGVRLDDVLPLIEREAMSDEDMVAFLAHALMEPSSPRPSIETLLHAFVPAKCVLHSHADAVVALTNNPSGEALVREVFGDELDIVPYMRPGFRMSRLIGEAARRNPNLKGVVLMNHGLVTWHSDPREAYRLHIEMANRCVNRIASTPFRLPEAPAAVPGGRRALAAAVAPAIRGMLGNGIMRYDGAPEVLRFVDWGGAEAAARQGAATPDHILSTGRRALFVAPDRLDAASVVSAARAALDRWQTEYRAWFAAHTTGETMLSPTPRVLLVKGLGMFCAWKDARATDTLRDIYHHTIAIMQAAEGLGGYRSLNDALAFINEYWPLELYKLSLAPPEKQLARKTALVTGAAGTIGAAIARRFAQEGAHVVCADLDGAKVQAIADGISRANPRNRALAVEMDVTSEPAVRAAFEAAALEYGGVDILVSNAGFAHNCPVESLTLEDWRRSLDVNATGHFLCAREALRMMKQQGNGGALVFIATKNVTAPGKDFAAYSAAKAAEAQLAKVIALEGGPFGIRSNIVNPDAVFEGSGLWSAEVVAERSKSYGIAPADLPDFYRKRSLLNRTVTASDVAEAALFFAGPRSAATTGAMLPVDAGVKEAFVR